MKGTTPSYVARLVQKHLPPAPIWYGPTWPDSDNNGPHGIRRIMYKAFLPPPQTDVPWYTSSISSKLKISYSFYSSSTGLDGEELEDLIENIRNRAWDVVPYPCFGRGWFLLPGLTGLDIWKHVLDAGEAGKTIVDLGCGLGQDLRRLRLEVGDGANLYGVDTKQELWDLGCELFGDVEEPPAKFICADALSWAKYGGVPTEISGKMDVVIMSQLIDLLWEPAQLELGKTIARLSKVGTKVVGCTFGTTNDEREFRESRGYGVIKRKYHDVCGRDCEHSVRDGGRFHTSFDALWEDIGKATRTAWKVEATCVELSEWKFGADDIACIPVPTSRGLNFVVTRER